LTQDAPKRIIINRKSGFAGRFFGKKEAESAAENPQKRGANLVQKPSKCRKSYVYQRISDLVKVLQNPHSPVQIWVSPPEINLVIVVKTTITRFIAFSDPFALPWG